MSLDFQLRRDVLLGFTTPIAQVRLLEAEAINPALKEEILRRAADEKGQVRSNVGGWHSGDDIFDWPGESIEILAQSAREGAEQMTALVNQAKAIRTRQTLKGWANVCRKGHYHLPHSHATYHWSGVYFVEAGEELSDKPHSGLLEFQDPRGAVEMAGTPGNPFGRTVMVTPKTGMMVLFPSWLQHWVRAYEGEDERISIAFNSRIDSFEKVKA